MIVTARRPKPRNPGKPANVTAIRAIVHRPRNRRVAPEMMGEPDDTPGAARASDFLKRMLRGPEE